MTLRAVVLALVVLLAVPAAGAASCIEQTPAEQRSRAEIIAEGVIVEGEGGRGDLRLRVGRYVKGNGPRELRIGGAGDSGVVTSVDIEPVPGERWRILGALRGDGAVTTTMCDGSMPLGGGAAASRGGSEASPASAARVAGSPPWLAGVAGALALGAVAAVWLRRRRASAR